jgi:hypothetical protein
VLKEIDHYLKLTETHTSKLNEQYLLYFRETVSVLIDKGHATSTHDKPSFGHYDSYLAGASLLVQQAIRAYWFGFTERCHHFIDRCLPLIGQEGQFNSYLLKFYYGKNEKCDGSLRRSRKQSHLNTCCLLLPRLLTGLNSLDMVKKNTKTAKSKDAAIECIAAVRHAASNSEWNFSNKLFLLEAEQYVAIQGNSFPHHHRILALYDASIASAKKSRFIHEQGLACEKAGVYCMRTRDVRKASVYFTQARQCYEEWGSSMKVDFIQKKLDDLCQQF